MQETIRALIQAAHAYKNADTKLAVVCGDNWDPIACTVFAFKGMHLNQLPPEAMEAGDGLAEITRLCGILITRFKLDPDYVRSLWFPILNA